MLSRGLSNCYGSDIEDDDAKNHQVKDFVSLDGQSYGGSCLRSKLARKLEKEV